MQHFPVSLRGDRGAFALLSHKFPVAGVIFVHGFLGNPRTTWVDFEHLIEQAAVWNEYDVYFYAYRSRNQIRPLAEEFAEFLMDVARAKERNVISPDFLAPSFRFDLPLDLWDDRGDSQYRHLILVGHSTGALIIREAIRVIMASVIKDKEDRGERETELKNHKILQSSLRFFAPAHLGVLGAGKLGLARSLPIIGRFTGAYLRSNPLYQNLKHDSPTILNLKRTTEDWWKKYKLEALKASSLFGKNEEVVYIGGYSHDEELPTIDGHDHVSVCKPRPGYLVPLEFVTHASSTGTSA